MYSVLFVCTGNQYRSPLAAACLRKILRHTGELDEYNISSAGTWVVPGLPASPVLVQFARNHNIELDDHHTCEVNLELLQKQDLVLVMEQGHREALKTEFPCMKNRIFLLSEVVDKHVYDIPDPAKNLKDFENLAGDLVELVERGAREICWLAKTLEREI